MKNLVTLLVLAGIGVFVYKQHIEKIRQEERAAAQAARPTAAKVKATPKLQAVALSRALEPLYIELFSPLKNEEPADLVPPIQITKERVLDLQAHADEKKKPVYAQCTTLLDAMIALAEERTKALESFAKSNNAKSSLDGPKTTSSSTAFFSQAVSKRWDDQKTRLKPRLDQLLAQLRNTERERNKLAGQGASVEKFELPDTKTVLVDVNHSEGYSNALEKGAYNQSRTNYPWRRAYYDRYGYPRSTTY